MTKKKLATWLIGAVALMAIGFAVSDMMNSCAGPIIFLVMLVWTLAVYRGPEW